MSGESYSKTDEALIAEIWQSVSDENFFPNKPNNFYLNEKALEFALTGIQLSHNMKIKKIE